MIIGKYTNRDTFLLHLKMLHSFWTAEGKYAVKGYEYILGIILEGK